MLSLVVHPRCETTLQTLNPQALATIIAHVGPGRIGNVVVPLLQDFEGVPLSLSREMKPAGVGGTSAGQACSPLGRLACIQPGRCLVQIELHAQGIFFDPSHSHA